jgi:hypothetical protein
MKAKSVIKSALMTAAALAWFLAGCSNEPSAPRAGTRASFWNAAKQAHKGGDYSKAVDNLEHVLRTDSEFTAQAQPWLVVLSAGMAQGYMEMADSFETGARANKANPGNLRKQVSVARAAASQDALLFADTFRKYLTTNKDKEVVLVFDYPTGTTVQPAQLKKVMTGATLADSEFESARRASIQRGILLTTCRAVGAGSDSAKTLAIFQKGEVKVPREVFVRGMAESLQEQAQLFASTKLDNPDRYKLMATLAQDALKTVPADKSTKELEKKIQDGLKKIKS